MLCLHSPESWNKTEASRAISEEQTNELNERGSQPIVGHGCGRPNMEVTALGSAERASEWGVRESC